MIGASFWWLALMATHGTGAQRATYRAYLQSRAWRRRRRRCLRRARGRCERCGALATQVHHRTYARVGWEARRDLEALCAPCHRRCLFRAV